MGQVQDTQCSAGKRKEEALESLPFSLGKLMIMALQYPMKVCSWRSGVLPDSAPHIATIIMIARMRTRIMMTRIAHVSSRL